MFVPRLNGRQTVYTWLHACWCVYEGWMGGRQCTLDQMPADVCTKAEWAANSVSWIICLLMCVRRLNGRQTVYPWSDACWCVYEGWISWQTVYSWSDTCWCMYEGWMGSKQCTLDQIPADVCTKAEWAPNSVPLIRCLLMYVRRLNKLANSVPLIRYLLMYVRRLNGRQTVYPGSYACWCVHDGWMGGKQCILDEMPADVCTKVEWAADSVPLTICLLMCVWRLNGRQTLYYWSDAC